MANNNNHDHDENDMSSDVSAVLDAVKFPADRDDLLDAADDAEVDDDLIEVLEDLPDEQYETRSDAEDAINQGLRSRRENES